MTVLEALAPFQGADGRTELWRAPALRVFRYGTGRSGGTGAVFPETPAVTALQRLQENRFTGRGTARLWSGDADGKIGSSSVSRGLRQAVGAEERRLSEAVRFLREQGRRPEADPGEIFAQLERRLLAEIGAG